MKRALFVLVLLAAAFLRFENLGEPSFWLDEVLAHRFATEAASQRWWNWLIGFQPDHGPLFYATQLASRAIESPEASARTAPALFGVATVALLWLAARRVSDGLLPVAAAGLLAMSPLHVYYSREARPYGLSMLLAAAFLFLLLGSRRLWTVCIVLVAALYTSAVAAPAVVAAAVTALAASATAGERSLRRSDWIFASLGVVTLCFLPLLYRADSRAPVLGFPVIDVAFLKAFVRAFSVTAINAPGGSRVALTVLALAIIGGIALTLRNRRQGIIVIAMAILPVFVSMTTLALGRHWYAVRYVSTALPAYLLLVGAGIVALAEFAGKRFGVAVTWVIVFAALAGMAVYNVPAARREPYQKLDWRLIATTLWSHAGDDDYVVTAEGWSDICLRFYLEQLPRRVEIAQVSPQIVAEILVAQKETVWFVSAGYSTDTAVREWICRFPVVMASPLEGFRLHYSPSAEHFLKTRSTAAERWAAGAAGVESLLRLAEWEPDGSAPYLDQQTAWRHTTTRLSPARWDRGAVTRLLSRLGFDPPRAWPRLSSGAVNLEDLAESIAPFSDCLDDRAFVRRVYAILLERLPDEDEERNQLELLRSGTSRIRLIGKIVNTGEFRRVIEQASG